jgi:predicted RNase H-like HicB family nuclease
MKIEIEREIDGRWLAEVPDLPGVMAYGSTRAEAIASVKALALRALADRIEHGEEVPALQEVFTVPATAVL